MIRHVNEAVALYFRSMCNANDALRTLFVAHYEGFEDFPAFCRAVADQLDPQWESIVKKQEKRDCFKHGLAYMLDSLREFDGIIPRPTDDEIDVIICKNSTICKNS